MKDEEQISLMKVIDLWNRCKCEECQKEVKQYQDELQLYTEIACCEKDGHDWMHIPLSDYVDCRRCGEVKK